MLNCLYDCRYCFLQGMYQSAHYVLFVNYTDFIDEIGALCAAHSDQSLCFFSGYDCDSLALEPVTGFVSECLPALAKLPNAWLELRTKSTQIRGLLQQPVNPRCIVAFSLSPEAVVARVEARTPSLAKRLRAIERLQARGWPIGLRFDPVLYSDDYQRQYRALFEQVFAVVEQNSLHSVSLGVFRLPERYFKKIHRLYPDERLLAGPLLNENGMVSYANDLEQEMLAYCRTQLLHYIPADKFFPCQ